MLLHFCFGICPTQAMSERRREVLQSKALIEIAWRITDRGIEQRS